MNWSTNTHGWDYPTAQDTSTSNWSMPSQPYRNKELKIIDNPLTPDIAIDCEMVEATINRRRSSVLARVSIVNSDCQPILDTYVDPRYHVSDYRTPYSGIRPEHLENAPSYESVRDCVKSLVEDRTIIGHDLKQDLAVLGLKNFQSFRTRDTSRCFMSYFEPNQKPSLKRLASAVLGEHIQQGAHDSLEDAKAAMRLYLHWLGSGKDEHEGVQVEFNNNNDSNSTRFINNFSNANNGNKTKQQNNQSNHNHHRNFNTSNNSNSYNNHRQNWSTIGENPDNNKQSYGFFDQPTRSTPNYPNNDYGNFNSNHLGPVVQARNGRRYWQPRRGRRYPEAHQ